MWKVQSAKSRQVPGCQTIAETDHNILKLDSETDVLMK